MMQGLAIHCHHDILVEYCYNYEERVQVIKRNKPTSEQEIRLRLFKILPDEALKDLPENLQKADAERMKAYAEWEKAYAEWEKAYAEWKKAHAVWEKANKEAFHKKWCGCDLWKNESIRFIEDAD